MDGSEFDLICLRSLLILASGSADVHKVMFASEILEAKSFKIGKLSPGRVSMARISMVGTQNCLIDINRHSGPQSKSQWIHRTSSRSDFERVRPLEGCEQRRGGPQCQRLAATVTGAPAKAPCLLGIFPCRDCSAWTLQVDVDINCGWLDNRHSSNGWT